MMEVHFRYPNLMASGWSEIVEEVLGEQPVVRCGCGLADAATTCADTVKICAAKVIQQQLASAWDTESQHPLVDVLLL